MKIDRRQFVVGSLAAAAAAACGSGKGPEPVKEPEKKPEPPAKKTILVLGGTNFIGPHIVTTALARGHTVTLFNRGKTHTELFPEVEKLRGDRDGQLDSLKGRTWDAVVDTSGFVPRIVKMSAELLAPSVKQYVFVSTISVYKQPGTPNMDENAPLETTPEPQSEDIPKYYGALKALSEQAAEAAMPGKVTVVRPGLIIGPGDPTGRFTHWPTRCADGGEVLAPGDGSTPVQYIDGRDLGDWIVHLIEQGTFGTMNALGPDKKITMREVLDACNAAGGNKAKLTWVDWKFLEKQDVAPWAEMPMWIPTEEDPGFGSMSNMRAVKAGLKFRPMAEIAKDTLAWLAALPADTPADKRARMISTGIPRDKETKVLAAWHAAGH
ncbi:MAG TPA: NAD-dependent epimerase/dehydratase family protein [Kofleriaceae bacterium]|nr:NAD-dependent epimerase/dehydratase family protein [Kofleriaceae bacterium]